MKKLSFLILCIMVCLLGQAQTPVNCYRIYLHDKADSPYSISRPQEFLSDRAIAKRTRFNIAVTEEDLPVNPDYLQAIRQVDDSILVLGTSRWFNTAIVRCPDSTVLPDILDLTFVDSIIPVGYFASITEQSETPPIDIPGEVYEPTTDTLQYGVGLPQIAIHNGHLLHNEGYKGDGMLITMLDVGWMGFDRIEYFSNLYDNGQILGTYNLVPGQSDVYWGAGHGTSCASIILSNINMLDAVTHEPLNFVGTAPNANMVFIRTEIYESEQLIEEDFWVCGAEIADSIGSDVISASLGYYQFTTPDITLDHSSLDGHTSIASLAATKAAHKGIVVCVAAGNEGSRDWHRILRPSDAEDILTVGAVGIDSIPANFTSVGPSYDGRVKPDVASVGYQCESVNVLLLPLPDGDLIFSYIEPVNGTSAATPCLAGLAACLWQALPQYSSLEIMQIVREAGHQYNTPDTLIGHGIPDFYRAYLEHIDTTGIQEIQLERNLTVYPNPCHNQCFLRNASVEAKEFIIVDMTGKIVFNGMIAPESEESINISSWSKGLYLLLSKRGKSWSEAIKIIRQ